MPYEPLFFTKENIIGYTGDIDQSPTVYFRKGNRFGRITQHHRNPDNVGRNLVREFDDYTIYNSADDNKAVEYYDGRTRHHSRNPFVSVNGNQEIVLTELASAIERFPNLKPKYRNRQGN